MTIKDLSDFLKKKGVKKEVVRLQEFSGRNVAIDANNLSYIFMSTASRSVHNATDYATEEEDRSKIVNRWLKSLMTFILSFLSAGITPVLCFDGKAPKEKDSTRQKRRSKREEAESKIKEAKEQLENTRPLQRTPDMVNGLRFLMNQVVSFEEGEMDLFKALFEECGIPVLTAKGEAEKLCSILCREGIVAAVYSRDYDNLVYGCPILMVDKAPKEKDDDGNVYSCVQVIRYKDVLSTLDMTDEEFVDFCIMCGCDYNERIRNVGTVKSYKYIKEYGSIDDIPSDELDTSCLNHLRCREIFKIERYFELIESGSLQLTNIFNIQGRSFQLRDFLSNYEMERVVDSLRNLYAMLPKPKIVISF
jgi:flap endonuclease-1